MGKLVRFRYRTNSEVVKLLRDYRNKELNVIPTNGYELCILSDEAAELLKQNGFIQYNN